jgi:4-oxalocrotonate tautomerase
MPILEVKILEGRTAEQKKQMIVQLTEALVNTINTTPADVRIHIVEMPKDSYAIAGKFISEK